MKKQMNSDAINNLLADTKRDLEVARAKIEAGQDPTGERNLVLTAIAALRDTTLFTRQQADETTLIERRFRALQSYRATELSIDRAIQDGRDDDVTVLRDRLPRLHRAIREAWAAKRP